MKLEVLKFPDPRLRKKGVEVKEVTPEMKKLAEDMLDTMYGEHGIGLAAPQVGASVRLLVMDTRPRDEDGNVHYENMTELERGVAQPIVIFNPIITKAENKTSYEEGCLSVPGFYENVERAQNIVARGMDINGKEIEITTDGLIAICLQHEMDHLDGKLFIDRLSFVKSSRIKTRIQKHGYPTADEVEDEREEVRARRKAAKKEAASVK